MTNQSRRSFLKGSVSIATSFLALKNSFLHGQVTSQETTENSRFGPLVPDSKGVLDLPAGFSYQVISQSGDQMDDGYITPGLPDAMATFRGSNGLTLLVMNHEMMPTLEPGPFGRRNELLQSAHEDFLYDRGSTPHRGGTTTLVYDTKRQQKQLQYLSLAGTTRNCAGGPTPWGSWISCEETTIKKGEGIDPDTNLPYRCSQDHGYNFEVPATSSIRLTKAIPLKEMGRFNHEAVAVDPRSGIVYQTEDRHDGLIYRYIPNVKERLASGGRLQALQVRDLPSADTRNWDSNEFEVGEVYQAEWIDLEEIDAPEDDLRDRGFKMGAARFARGEGMWYSKGQIFFACTNGGSKRAGQIWRYIPKGDSFDKGRLELFIEPNNSELLQAADNLTVAPWGDLIVCEDRDGDVVRIVGVMMQGELYTFAANHLNTEFAGSTFSPDGSTLFVNLQHAGLTVAITGPWLPDQV